MTRKFIPFEEVEKLATIEQLASMLNLPVRKSATQLRCPCPIHGGGDRGIAISPEVRSKRGSVGVFFCQAAQTGGDRIGLVAHCMDIGQQDAALFIQEQFGTGTVNSEPVTSNSITVSKSHAAAPQEQKAEPTASKFDPDSYASQLVYDDRVEALGISAEKAEQVKIGVAPKGIYRGMVCFPIRDGDITDFVAFDPATGTIKVPKHWANSKVVPLKKKTA